MRNRGQGFGHIAGYAVTVDPDAPYGSIEVDTFQCCHCNRHFEREVGKGPKAMCLNCAAPTCGEAACDPCIPFEAKLEAMEGTREKWKGQDILPPGLFVPRPVQEELEQARRDLIVARR